MSDTCFYYFYRTASVSPNAERNRDFVGQAEEEEDEKEEKRREKEELDLPLKLASLAGRQEIVLKFSEMNQFGLPRAVDEVEVGLGHLALHVFPHQVNHCTTHCNSILLGKSRSAKGQIL